MEDEETPAAHGGDGFGDADGMPAADAGSPADVDEDAADADVRRELERMRADVARAEARAAEAYAESVALREQLRMSASDAATADALRAQIASATERERHAASRYRELVLRSEPSLPAELVSGDSIDAVEQSLGAAREVVGRVRQQMEQQAQTARVPAGAPVRSSPDVSAMTPDQKIRYGLSQRR